MANWSYVFVFFLLLFFRSVTSPAVFLVDLEKPCFFLKNQSSSLSLQVQVILGRFFALSGTPRPWNHPWFYIGTLGPRNPPRNKPKYTVKFEVLSGGGASLLCQGHEMRKLQRGKHGDHWTYCWWKKSCTTCYLSNPTKNGIFSTYINWCRISAINSMKTAADKSWRMKDNVCFFYWGVSQQWCMLLMFFPPDKASHWKRGALRVQYKHTTAGWCEASVACPYA